MSQLQAIYDEYQQTIRSLQEHVVSVESQLYEHEIVIETLQGVPSDRKAWRMVSNGDSIVTKGKDNGENGENGENGDGGASAGALVETSAGDACIKLQETTKGLKELKVKLETEISDVRKEFEEWKVKNNIKIVRG